MSDDSKRCANCGAEVGSGKRFCGRCGLPSIPPAAPEDAPSPKRTIVGMGIPGVASSSSKSAPSADEPAPPAPSSGDAAAPGAHKKTMLGMGAVRPAPVAATPLSGRPSPAGALGAGSAPAAPATPAAPRTPPGGPAPGAAGGGATKRTMVGTGAASPPAAARPNPWAPAGGQPPASPSGPAPGGAGPGAQSAGAPPARTKRTVVGMPAQTEGSLPPGDRAGDRAADSGQPAPQPEPPSQPPAASGEGAPAPPPLANTMLGASPEASPAPRVSPASSEPTADSAATPAAEPPPGAAEASGADADAGAAAAARPRAPALQPEASATLRSPAAAPRRRSSIALTVTVAALVSAAVGFGAFWVLRGPQSDVQARVEMTDEGEMLVLEVPGAEPGTAIRFGGQTRELQDGAARFALGADSLRVGENMVLAEVVRPGGQVRSERITLQVPYRVRADLAPLQSGDPAIDVVVEARPGASVTLDGEQMQIDETGKAVKRYPVDVSARDERGIVEHVVAFRVRTPEGEVRADELRTVIPLASLQIDRPGMDVVTDQDSIEIAGAVAPNARVTVDGEPVAVEEGRFVYTMALPEVGDYEPTVVSRVPGKAPYQATLHIERVEDLGRAAAKFEADPSLTYERIADDPSIYKKQRMAVEGRVYNVDVDGGRSVLQILVHDCPATARCPLWVTYSAATDVSVGDRVRVLGVVEGKQKFRSERNRVVTVPKVAARYVLKAER